MDRSSRPTKPESWSVIWSDHWADWDAAHDIADHYSEDDWSPEEWEQILSRYGHGFEIPSISDVVKANINSGGKVVDITVRKVVRPEEGDYFHYNRPEVYEMGPLMIEATWIEIFFKRIDD